MAERAANLRWIDPQGGFGDLLILSGVMKEVFDRTGRQYNVVSCHGRRWLFADHPAVRHYGRPPKDAPIEVMNYGYEAEHQRGGRPYPVLARMFGLDPPGEERLYAPLEKIDIQPLCHYLPPGQPWVAICPSSNGPRKEMAANQWEKLVAIMAAHQVAAIQLGNKRDRYIRGAYNFLGLTTPAEALALLAKMQAVITVDSFLMHGAFMQKTPAIVLWGPTNPAVFGYDVHVNLRSLSSPCEVCPKMAHEYLDKCPQGEELHCMNRFDMGSVWLEVKRIVKNK